VDGEQYHQNLLKLLLQLLVLLLLNSLLLLA